MSNIVDLFWSFRSPYSYLCTPQTLELAEDFDVEVRLRVVKPKALRTPEFFGKESVHRVKYLFLDWPRRAELLGLPHAWPSPDPVVQNMETMEIAKEQPYIYRLMYLGIEAQRRGRGIEFVTEVSRLIWGGTKDWDKGDHLTKAAERADLDLADMEKAIQDSDSYEQEIEENQQALADAGHWGVPTYVYRGEPFFGQDRIDSLRFQLEKDGLKR